MGRADRGSLREGGTDDLRQEGPLARHYHGRRAKQLLRKPLRPVAAVVVGKAGDRTRCRCGRAAGAAITADNDSLSLRGVVVHGHHPGAASAVRGKRMQCRAGTSVFFGQVIVRASGSLQNVLVCGGGAIAARTSQLRHCTIAGPLHLAGMSSIVSDCIVSSIIAANDGHRIEHCDVFGDNPYMNQAVPGKGCLKTPPQFVDPKSFDFRLQSLSPCRKAASDGGDMGFTCTAEIQALLNVAADLRNRARGN